VLVAGVAGSKTLLKQNPPVLNWGCQCMQFVLYNGHKIIVVVVVVVVRRPSGVFTLESRHKGI